MATSHRQLMVNLGAVVFKMPPKPCPCRPQRLQQQSPAAVVAAKMTIMPSTHKSFARNIMTKLAKHCTHADWFDGIHPSAVQKGTHHTSLTRQEESAIEFYSKSLAKMVHLKVMALLAILGWRSVHTPECANMILSKTPNQPPPEL